MLNHLLRYHFQDNNHTPAIGETFEQIRQQILSIRAWVVSDYTQQQINCRIVTFIVDIFL
jgi:hypothetical protein